MVIHLGYRVVCATINAEDGQQPHVTHTCAPGREDHILISMAGNAAVDLFKPNGYAAYQGGEQDAADYRTDLDALIPDNGLEPLEELDEKQDRLLRSLERKTDRILRGRRVRRAVIALATRLLEQNTIDGPEVHALVEPLLFVGR
jgi:hypothetical protein